MKWICAAVTFDASDRSMATELVADIFYSLGLKGVLIDDSAPDPLLDWAQDPVPAKQACQVTGYFPDTASAAQRCEALETALARLQRNVGLVAQVAYTRIDDQDWAEAWKEHFWPLKLTDRIVVKPTWRAYAPKPKEVIIDIDPGMAFGTGTHPTTALCIRMMQNHLKHGDAFLDVGTGSGILLVTAAKLGAGHIIGVDNDEVALSVAEKNIDINKIDKKRVTLLGGHLVELVAQTADVVVANILAEVILQLIPDLSGVLKDNGVFIGSGIVTEKKEGVLRELAVNGFVLLQVEEQAGWVAIAATKRSL